jgi:ribosomal protein S18 acetylase RimI-like enzyme
MQFERLSWDTAFFGFPIGKAVRFDGRAVRNEFLKAMDEADLQLAYVETASRHPQLDSWHVVDQVTLHRGVGLSDDQRSSDFRYSVVSHPVAEPSKELTELAKQAGWSSRFCLDSRFDECAFTRLYSTWISRSCLREIADEVIVVVDRERCCGFVTASCVGDICKIGLIAVSEQYRRQGVGHRLLVEVAQAAREKECETIAVVTQSVNAPALKLYRSFGFQDVRTSHWYHIWSDEQKR